MRSRFYVRSAIAGVRPRRRRAQRARAFRALVAFAVVIVSLLVLRPLAAFGDTSASQPSVDIPSEVVEKATSTGQAGVIVQLAPAADPATNKAAGHKLLADVGEHAPDAHVIDSLGVVAMSATPDQLRGLARSKLVTRIEPDTLLSPALDKSTPRIGAPTAWAAGIRGQDQTVALIDSGVDTSHPALQGKVVYEACFSNTSCPNGLSTQLSGAGTARPCTLGLACEHGTHVAGIIAGNAGNLSGVAPAANLIAIQVFSRSDSAADCGAAAVPCPRARTSDVLAALDHVYDIRAQVPHLVAVNMSLSSDSASANCDASILAGSIRKLRDANIATIVATGNGGVTNGLGVPACISSTISVAATYSDHDAVWPLSNVSAALKLLAPGVSINSPAPGGGFSPTTGTSAAAPHVAGAWALVAQKTGTQDVGKILDFLQVHGTKVQYALPDGSVLEKPRIDVSSLATAGLVPAVNTPSSAQMSPNPCVGCLGLSGDFNGDGRAGIFWYGRGSGNSLWNSTGDGSFTVTPQPNVPDGYIPLVGDFNGDGKADLFWYSKTGGTNWLWTSIGNGQFVGTMAPGMFANMRSFVGDFNGDGFADIFFYAPGDRTSWIFYGAPAARFTGLPTPFVGGDFTPFAGDFDGDGRTDIFWFNPSGWDYMWRSFGGNLFAGMVGPQIDGPYTAAVGDFNGDGKADIMWYAGAHTTGWLWTAVGNMNFNGVQYPIDGDTSYVPIAGDFKGDHRFGAYLYGGGTRPDRVLLRL
jgi:subtilisin family serine protease